jgi:hypothetical protein
VPVFEAKEKEEGHPGSCNTLRAEVANEITFTFRKRGAFDLVSFVSGMGRVGV